MRWLSARHRPACVGRWSPSPPAPARLGTVTRWVRRCSACPARDACSAAGGYLVAISSEAEDDFVHELLEADHWLGASDGRSDGSEGVGDYEWLSGEDWDYSNWEDGQPNAVATNCPNENSGSNCFEHCAYQEESGGWIDRACWHTIASVCEWEPKGKPTPEPEQ